MDLSYTAKPLVDSATGLEKHFSFKLMALKGLKYVVIFGLPMLVDKFIVSYPEYAQLSIAGALVMLVNYLKLKVGVRYL